ncbi:MAG: hypothetical protein FWH03_08645 [Firmicutes bacterium]|nr:hypothetical protein [Bacillota bacterium]
MKKKLIAVISVLMGLCIAISLFASCKETEDEPDTVNFTGLNLNAVGTTTLPATLTLPAVGNVSLQLQVSPQGDNLPDNMAFVWSVTKNDIPTADATITNGLFVTAVAGAYKVRVSSTVGTVMHSAEAQITVNPDTQLSFTGINLTVNNAAPPAILPMPASGPATMQFTATATGLNLPNTVNYVWSVEKDGAVTSDATIASGLFSTTVLGEYTVKVSATIESVTRNAQATILVTDPNAVIFTGITISGATLPATLPLPQNDDPATLQLTASAQGQNLPADNTITFVWTVEKGGAATDDATVTNGLFSSLVVGAYTVKVSATIDGETKEASASITVSAAQETMAQLIERVEQSDNETVLKSIAVQFALRQAKSAMPINTEARRAALSDAYWTAFDEYPSADYTIIIDALGPIWAGWHVGDNNPNSTSFNNFRFPVTAVFRNSDGVIVDILYKLPTGTLIFSDTPNNNTGFYDGAANASGPDAWSEFWLNWTTTRDQVNTYLDIMHHFIGMTAQTVSTFTDVPRRGQPPGGGALNDNEYRGMFYAQQTTFLRSGATETSENFTSSLVVASQQFLQTPQGQALLG